MWLWLSTCIESPPEDDIITDPIPASNDHHLHAAEHSDLVATMPYFKGHEGKQLFFTNTQPETPSHSEISLLFLHGLGASSSAYFPIIPSLSAMGFRCITMDTYGNGLSIYAGGENTIMTIADDARALLAQLNITKNVVVVGHSMGCIVASQLAAADERGVFVGVVLLGPTHPGPNVVKAMDHRVQMIEKGGMEVIADTAPKAATGSGCHALARAFLREMLVRNDTKAYTTLCSAIANADVPDYAAINKPLLVLVGEEDATLEGAQHIALTYATPKGEKEVRLLPDCGHWLVLEAPDLVLKHIGEFLAKLLV
ncbi:hypothetical protein KEM52_002163 [Ascosphaera acerosa]|nr:hypothetical protein KEM52_002163 [Ascosphaera acerosa]